jgi:hypothetical protein
MTADPQPERLDLPPGYGTPAAMLTWEEVRGRLEDAPNYWLATVRPDGRPHVVPLDGLWQDGAWWFGGSPQAVKHRNLLADGRAVLHLADPVAAVIVEGVCGLVVPDGATARRLAKASRKKYGYGPPPSSYAEGVWRLRPSKVMAWTSLPADATRFRFPENPGADGRTSR